MLAVLAAVAPGQPLRDGLYRIRQSGKGALIVIGDEPEVLDICSGGFLLDARFSPQRLHEVAKMDGAIILAGDGSRIARANVHLVPDPSVATVETGTRHRTAERVARWHFAALHRRLECLRQLDQQFHSVLGSSTRLSSWFNDHRESQSQG